MTIDEMEKQRLKAEALVNKSWFSAEQFKDNIRETLDRDPPYNEADILFLRLASHAFMSKVTLADFENMIQDKVNEAPEA